MTWLQRGGLLVRIPIVVISDQLERTATISMYIISRWHSWSRRTLQWSAMMQRIAQVCYYFIQSCNNNAHPFSSFSLPLFRSFVPFLLLVFVFFFFLVFSPFLSRWWWIAVVSWFPWLQKCNARDYDSLRDNTHTKHSFHIQTTSK